MNLRHIIFEGCDGAGKDTMIKRIMETEWGEKFILHKRASKSDKGPVPDLDTWVEEDNCSLLSGEPGPYIYNRHPLISELIYHDLREINPGLKGKFKSGPWIQQQRSQLASVALLVLIHPPLRVVKEILAEQKPQDQMPGVLLNLRTIHQRYSQGRFFWPGVCYVYDRTRSNPVSLINAIQGTLGEK